MKRLAWIALAAVSLAAATAAMSQSQAGKSCTGLAVLRLPLVTITSAAMVPATTAYCRVRGFAVPTPDSHIGFEVWIPDNWNGRYLQVGNGGFAGVIPE